MEFLHGGYPAFPPDSSGMTEHRECRDILRWAGGSTQPIVGSEKLSPSSRSDGQDVVLNLKDIDHVHKSVITSCRSQGSKIVGTPTVALVKASESA